jgi:DNA-directed RNA polymerase specialized sigma24 family protein
MLREYEQLSYGEIAELLQMPLNTVRSRLFRARIALKQQLVPEANAASTAATIKAVRPPVANPVEGEA